MISCPVERIGLPLAAEYVGFDFWADKFVPPFKGEVRAELPPGGSCRILAIRPVSAHPQLLSTSRHITQGIVDVTDEKWSAAAAALSAVSRVVGEDPCELRIIAPAGESSWRVAGVSVSAEDQAAGVKADFKQQGPEIRATLSSPVSRKVRWQVKFVSPRSVSVNENP